MFGWIGSGEVVP